jgi:hypothetical protein
MAVSGGIGALVGLPIGTIVGGTDEYILIDTPRDTTVARFEGEEIIKHPDQLVDIRVSSIEVEGDIIIWQGKKIRLTKSEVIQRKKIGDEVYIRISEDLYESKFK